MAASVERLLEVSPDGLGALLAESEQAGLRFVRRLVDEWASGANRFDRPGEALFAARVGGRLVGVCGLNVDPYAAEPRLGRVRHLYVLTAYRRLGVGGQLVATVIAAARGRFDDLRLRTENPAAAFVYERAGFRPSAEAHCTHVLDLRRARSGLSLGPVRPKANAPVAGPPNHGGQRPMNRLVPVSIGLTVVALLAASLGPAAAAPHPMDPLTAEEIIGAASILLDGGAARPGAIFQAIDLREPATPCG